jgi:ribosomal protein S12 methylthiotransferase accessory factor
MSDGHRKRSSTPRRSELVRFVPNFTVFILPPDVVCLYSEDRKFFLHGELYVALASAIGAGKRRPQDIVRALAGDFNRDKVNEALSRLLERRFVVRTRGGDGAAAAYWATLGLMPDTALTNLDKVGVSIEPLGGAGATELDAALRELGVRVVSKSPDLMVVPVSDYLDSRLADFNARQLAGNRSWLPVQVSGVFPLVGPIFSPGVSACWTCLAERMKWNRQVKAFLDRKAARCVTISALATDVLGPTGIGLASIEIAKAVASGFRSDLRNHLVSLDLMGSTILRHFVPKRPQCPACGHAELRDPNRSPAPIMLAGGGTHVMTSGGYRIMPPAATVSRYRKHVSALTGVVSRLQRIESTLPLNATFIAKHNFSPRPETVEALTAGLAGDSYGKGSTADQAEASALMEAIERYSGIFQGNEVRTTRRFADFPPGDAIPPNDILLISAAQYSRGGDQAPCGHLEPHQHDNSCPHANEHDEVRRRFDPSSAIEWSPVWSLRDGRFKYAPTGLLYFHHKGSGDDQLSADSNGCAAGNTLEEAIVQGFLELVERDSYAIWWYNRVQRGEVDLDALDDPYIRQLKAQFAAAGRDMWLLDITHDLGIPSVVAVAHWSDGAKEHIEYGSGAHFDLRIAALRAVTELNQCLAIAGLGGGEARAVDIHGDDPLPLRDNPFLRPKGKAAFASNSVSEFAGLDPREQVLACVRTVKRQGMDFLVLDQTRLDIEVPVARVIVPGMRHFYRRFAPGRLYDVPVKLGWLRRQMPEAELNPLHPRT